MKSIFVLLVVTYFATIISGRQIEFGPPHRNYDIKPKGQPLIRKARDLGNSFDEFITNNDDVAFELENSEFDDELLNRPTRDVSVDTISPYQLTNIDEVEHEWQNFQDDLLNRPVRDVSSNFDDSIISPYQMSDDDNVAYDWQNSEYNDGSSIRHSRDVSNSFFDQTLSPYDEWQNSEFEDDLLSRHVRDVASSNFDELLNSESDQDLQNWDEQNSYGINHIRNRRQLIGNVEADRENGVKAMVGAEGKLIDDNGHTLIGRGTVTKQFSPNQPPVISGALDYTGPRVGASVGVDHARHMGTSLNTQANYNIYTSPNRRTTFDTNAYYQQQFQPRSRPDFGGGFTLRHRF